MNILTFGPNGSGKGTQGAIIKEKYGIDHIESGAIFREHIKGGTELGKKAKALIDRGDLVPDEITIPMVLETLGKSKEKGWLL
ncbi:MAG: nucleoside monophosphate kinase, partial [Desulfobulbus sp.]